LFFSGASSSLGAHSLWAGMGTCGWTQSACNARRVGSSMPEESVTPYRSPMDLFHMRLSFFRLTLVKRSGESRFLAFTFMRWFLKEQLRRIFEWRQATYRERLCRGSREYRHRRASRHIFSALARSAAAGWDTDNDFPGNISICRGFNRDRGSNRRPGPRPDNSSRVDTRNLLSVHLGGSGAKTICRPCASATLRRGPRSRASMRYGRELEISSAAGSSGPRPD